jgi:hypothetical protein
MDEEFHEYKRVRIQIQPRELPKSGWVMDVMLYRHGDEVGTKLRK